MIWIQMGGLALARNLGNSFIVTGMKAEYLDPNANKSLDEIMRAYETFLSDSSFLSEVESQVTI